ncbi:MAG TPA: acylphosphatase [Thermoanaerobaculia bacterium]|nr:acylphosphatase [Thermoanaerobaculia bacterium]
MESIHLEVRGRVQGVGFRWYVVDKAHEFRLAGWVKNKADGNVELAAAGKADDLARFEAAITAGPPGARVEDVRRLPVVPADSLQAPFGIVR